jgi:hypothetical protein
MRTSQVELLELSGWARAISSDILLLAAPIDASGAGVSDVRSAATNG